MDYKYIEQLLERYWECETSLEEEQILRSFFNQKDVPARLLQYKEIFSFSDEDKQNKLGDDFDARMLVMVEEQPAVEAKRIPLWSRFSPIVKAAAAIAIVLTIGSITEKSILRDMPESVQTDYMAYPQTYRQTDVVTATNNVDNAALETGIDSIMPINAKSMTNDQQQ
ncbi:MAG: hypothetical protein IKH26_07780 [Bacteroidaceae bacterium]|nr:hypothetical protein [Bacteroidaceae bacterium]